MALKLPKNNKLIVIISLIVIAIIASVYYLKQPKIPIVNPIISGCLNSYVDQENKVSFCLPANYIKVSSENKETYGVASFTPIQNSTCSAKSGSYCYVLFFTYYTGDTEVPPKRSPSADISRLDKTFQTDSGELMTVFSPFSPSIAESIYSYQLKNGSYAYFDFVTAHPKQNSNELDNHLKILKSVKQI